MAEVEDSEEEDSIPPKNYNEDSSESSDSDVDGE